MSPPRNLARSLTGDPVTDAVVPAATRLVWAVREQDPDAVDAAINEVIATIGAPGERALTVVLAAMVNDDRSPRELLAWLTDPHRYRELRLHGHTSESAVRAINTYDQRGCA